MQLFLTKNSRNGLVDNCQKSSVPQSHPAVAISALLQDLLHEHAYFQQWKLSKNVETAQLVLLWFEWCFRFSKQAILTINQVKNK